MASGRCNDIAPAVDRPSILRAPGASAWLQCVTEREKLPLVSSESGERSGARGASRDREVLPVASMLKIGSTFLNLSGRGGRRITTPSR